MTLTKIAGCLLAVALAAACNSKDQEAKHPEPMTAPTSTSPAMPTSTGAMNPDRSKPSGDITPTAMDDTSGRASNGGTSGSGMNSGMNSTDTSKSTPSFSDAEMAAIVDAANNGEIEQGKLAQKSAKDAGIKSFAKMMVDHHSEARDKQSKLLSKMSVTASENAKSREVKADGQSNLDKIKGLKGAEFDRAYIDTQIKEHQTVLALLDAQIPSAKNADYKAYLQEVRGRVEQHLKAAEELQKKMKPSGG